MTQPIERHPLPPEIQTSVERRKSPRTPVVVRVSYATVDVLFSEFTRNINEGGLFIETDRPEQVDSLVSLQFQLPGSEEPIHAEGRVVWVSEGEEEDPPGMGVHFEELGPEARSRINELVRRLRADRPPPPAEARDSAKSPDSGARR